MTQWIITSSVLILIIAVLRFVLRGKISLKLQYALWGLVLIRLILPFSIFESPASVLNFMNERKESNTPPVYSEPYVPETITPAVPDEDIFILDDNIEHIKPDTNIVVDDNGYITEPEIKVFDWGNVLMGVWLAGTAAFGAVFAVSNLRFRKKLKTTREYVRGTKAWLPVYESAAIKTPCLFGAVKPAIYVTKEVLEDEKVFFHVLEHETTHYHHGDHVWSVLRCFCLALHWYNPLVWLAAFLSMRDSELACDEDTIKRIGEEERIGYGRTLINLTCEKPAVGILSAATTMTGSKSSIKERIMLIAKKPKMLKITAALVAVIAVFAVSCTFTGAIKYNPKTTEKEVSAGYISEHEGISMEVLSVSEDKIETVVYNYTENRVSFSYAYRLHFEQNGKWYELPILDENHDEVREGMFRITAGEVQKDRGRTWENELYEPYGRLPDGKYRIVRTCVIRDAETFERINESYIAAEFVLSEGKVAVGLQNGDYIPAEQLYLNLLSSSLGIPKHKYYVTENAFIIFDNETGEEIEKIEVPLWNFVEFPYSEKEWEELFTAGINIVEISQNENILWHKLDETRSLMYVGGEIWLTEIHPIKPGSEEMMLWSILRIVPEHKAEKRFDEETERLMEILWNSDLAYKEIAENGYTFYGAEELECLGYENLFAFASKFPTNKGENFYVASLNTTWVLSEIFYSKDQKSWIYTEYWIDTFNGNERNEKSFEISEIKTYDNRISIYFKTGGKKIIYRDGSVQGLPINNCSHPEQAHYIDYEIIKYINSEEFRAEYEKTHSEPYLDFDAFTNTLYEEEEKCLVNIYHYAEHYGLSYDDFIAAYSTEENIAEIWGEADIKGYYDYRESGTPLTADEIRRVSEAFEAFRIKDNAMHVNVAANFLQGEFNKPEEINAVAVLYYFPSGILITDEAEFEDLKETWASYGYTVPEGTTIESYPVPLHKIPKSMVDEALEKYLGIGLEELKYSDLDSLAENGVYYMEKYDCFYSTASDTHAARFVCESGEIFPDGTVVLYEEGGRTLILKKHPDGSYKLYSYQW